MKNKKTFEQRLKNLVSRRKKKRYGFYLSTELMDKLKALSSSKNISYSSAVGIILEQAIENNEVVQ